ncbi:microtubule-associated protein tau isoform X3 [Rhopalosiphum maidis]|uniref:microtubule-associated protein tau isoform X3 n=1 Tax=Rhopalosiphum maidis TaxID=43146 RepID=UPI000EFEB119|nr:microtubule-associated protein tau isoform X3 [Rhopalosiphum maidis]
MDSHRRSSIVEPTGGGYVPDTRSQLNTTTVQPKPSQRAPEFGSRPSRPEFYQQGPYGITNRPQGQQQRLPPPRMSGDNKASPWNIIRQTLPPDVGVRSPVQLQQQRGPPSQNYNNINNNSIQQRPPLQQEQQQYRQQMPMQERRGPASRVPEERSLPQFRSDNGRQVRPVEGSADDDEEVIVNSTINQQLQQQQQLQPALSRRDSTVFAGGRAADGTSDPNKQWQPKQAAQGVIPYGKPQPQEQQYGRQSLVMPEGQEQIRFPAQTAAGGYNSSRLAVTQEDEGNRQPVQAQNGIQKVRDVQQQQQQQKQQQQHSLMRRDSVLDANTAKVNSIDMMSRRNDGMAEYGRRPAPDLQDDSGSRWQPELIGGGRRPPPMQDSVQEDGKRSLAEYKKTEQEDTSGKRLTDFKNSRPEAGAAADYGAAAGRQMNAATRLDDRPHDKQSYEQPRNERKASLEKDQPAPRAAAVEHGNRASELRKMHFEATHLKPVREQQHVANDDSKVTAVRGRVVPPVDETKARDYTAAAVRSTDDGNPSNERYRAANIAGSGNDEAVPQMSKNSRPDTLKIIKDNEPLKDSSNSKVDRQNENDVGKSPSKIPKKDRSELKTPTRAVTPKSPESLMSIGQKRLPMNKVQVGSAPSPNLKVVRSKVGSLQNTSHKPGGGQVKIENRKLEWKAGTRVEAKNDAYVPGGGDKKIQSVKLQWNAKPKVGSLDNKTHKPGGGDKKIETVKLDFKDKAKPKIGSKDNIKHTPGGGAVKSQSTQLLEKESHDIEDQKLDIKAQSKVGSLDNVKHRPGGGEVKIFDDKSYIKQTTAGQIGTPTKTQLRRSSSLKSPLSMKLYSPDERPKSHVKIVVTPTSEEDLYNKIATDNNKGGFRRSAYIRSPSLHNDIVIPEEAVKTKK